MKIKGLSSSSASSLYLLFFLPALSLDHPSHRASNRFFTASILLLWSLHSDDDGEGHLIHTQWFVMGLHSVQLFPMMGLVTINCTLYSIDASSLYAMLRGNCECGGGRVNIQWVDPSAFCRPFAAHSNCCNWYVGCISIQWYIQEAILMWQTCIIQDSYHKFCCQNRAVCSITNYKSLQRTVNAIRKPCEML